MIDYKSNYIFSLLQEKALKTFSRRESHVFYDRRTKTAFRRILSFPKPLNKYYFTDTTMLRVKAMDLSKCDESKLDYLFDKYGGEVGICICRDNNLAFVYVIGASNIQLIVTSGLSGTIFYEDVPLITTEAYKMIPGACVINYQNADTDILVNNLISLLSSKNKDLLNSVNRSSELRKEIYKINKEISKLPEDRIFKDIPKNDSTYLNLYVEDYIIKQGKILDAIKMFIFLKTASVVEKTFVSENQNYGSKSKSKNNDSVGIIVVDSTWDSSIHVINPFAVSGHFRDQPKKNDKGKWYKELIYIDSYMKSGYCRKAKITPT